MSSIKDPNIKQNPLLNIPSIPTFGIYDTNNYILMEPIHIIKSQRMMPDNLPPTIFKNIKLLFQKYKQIIPEFYHITLDANNIYINSNERKIETNYARINLVAHPYIFNNQNFSQTSKTHINCAIFKENEELEALMETDEVDSIKINPECEIISNTLNREILLEIEQNDKKYFLQPNNCSFLINLNSQIINFYTIVLGMHNNRVTKCFVGNYIIIPNSLNCHLLKTTTQNLINCKSNEEMFLSLMSGQLLYNDSLMGILFYFLDKIVKKRIDIKNFDDLKNIFLKAFTIIFEFDTCNVSQKEHEEDLNNISEFYFEQIKKYINFIYPGSNFIENFSENILYSSLKNNYIIEIIIKYIDFHLSRLNNIICSYFDYFDDEINLAQIKSQASKMHKEKNWKILQDSFCKQLNINKKEFDEAISFFVNKGRKKIVNHNIDLFDKLCKELLETQKINMKILEEIDEPIRKYFYYHIWVYKGKLSGIHKNFGKHSFLCSDKIKSIYHCSLDERYNFTDQMKSVLIEADSPYRDQK